MTIMVVIAPSTAEKYQRNGGATVIENRGSVVIAVAGISCVRIVTRLRVALRRITGRRITLGRVFLGRISGRWILGLGIARLRIAII